MTLVLIVVRNGDRTARTLVPEVALRDARFLDGEQLEQRAEQFAAWMVERSWPELKLSAGQVWTRDRRPPRFSRLRVARTYAFAAAPPPPATRSAANPMPEPKTTVSG